MSYTLVFNNRSFVNNVHPNSVEFVTSYNPILPNINSLINKYLPILHADLDLK